MCVCMCIFVRWSSHLGAPEIQRRQARQHRQRRPKLSRPTSPDPAPAAAKRARTRVCGGLCVLPRASVETERRYIRRGACPPSCCSPAMCVRLRVRACVWRACVRACVCVCVCVRARARLWPHSPHLHLPRVTRVRCVRRTPPPPPLTSHPASSTQVAPPCPHHPTTHIHQPTHPCVGCRQSRTRSRQREGGGKG